MKKRLKLAMINLKLGNKQSKLIHQLEDIFMSNIRTVFINFPVKTRIKSRALTLKIHETINCRRSQLNCGYFLNCDENFQKPLPKSEPIKIDIITFGIGAKIYFYEGGSCIGEESVEILHDDFVSFICVEKSHEFTVKNKHLAELYNHKIGITLADNKLLVSS